MSRESLSGVRILARNSITSTPRNDVDLLAEFFENTHHRHIDDRNWSWGFLRLTFQNLGLGELFERYTQRLQTSFFNVYLLLQAFFSISYILVVLIANEAGDEGIPEYIGHGVIAATAIATFFLVCDERMFRRHPRLQIFLSFGVTCVFVSMDVGQSVYFHFALNRTRTSLAFHSLIAIYMFLPLPRKLYAIVLASIVSGIHLTLSGILLYKNTTNRTQRIFADFVLYFCINGVGIYSKMMIEVAVRRAFLDRRNYIQSTIRKNFEEKQEDQLLSSILPTNISIKVKRDLRLAIKQIEEEKKLGDSSTHRPSTTSVGKQQAKPFTDMYVEPHEEVSLIFADIVNFTPLTEQMEAAELVETLNKLFGSFDESAKALNITRIKLLGDCYYCFSGTPTHADDCVRLGFEMIEIARDIREKIDCNIKMRIGIHSGNILSGILGFYKWHFDIWSKDVTIANQLEQTGEPDRIHISKQTKDYLGEKYTFERREIEKRNNYLIENNIESFLIKPPNERIARVTVEENDADESADVPRKLKNLYNRSNSIINLEKNKRKGSVIGPVDSIIRARKKSIPGGFERFTDVKGKNIQQFNMMLREVNRQMAEAIEQMPLRKSDQWCPREERKQYTHVHPLFLSFDNRGSEIPFQNQPDPLFKFYVACSLFILICIGVIQALIVPTSHKVLWVAFGISLSVILGLIPFVWVRYLWAMIKDPRMEMWTILEPENKLVLFFYKMSNTVINSWILRKLMFLIIVVLISATSIIDIIECDDYKDENELVEECKSPWYFTYCCGLAILCIHGFFKVNFILKLSMTILSLSTYISTILIFRESVFDKDIGASPALEPVYSHIIYLIRIGLYLHIMDRQMEYISRLDFVWKEKLNEELKEANRTQQVNKILITNILPMRIATIFMDPNRSGEGHSRNYQNISVVFASVPGFTDFYTENAINEHGFQCLKVLNEIIVEFDQALEEFSSNDIEKIKVIGSTYMAACGLEVRETTRHSTSYADITNHNSTHGYSTLNENSRLSNNKRRRTLHALTKFAAHLMARLQDFNRNAFQNFQLRVGIDCGPVVAGVIGTRKPHYDIWGDTVNVAARMESSGVCGKIQVTEKSARYLALEGVACEMRGSLQVKGKGLITTHFVKLNSNFELEYSNINSEGNEIDE